MKITNRKILTDANFLGQLTQKQLPIKISYALAKNISKIENELKIYNSEKDKLIDQYAIKDEKGNLKVDENNQFKVREEYKEVWEKEIEELLDIEINLDVHKIKLDELMLSNCNMTPAELMLIDYMIEE